MIVTFTAVMLTVVSAFTLGIASGYLAICGILRLINRPEIEAAGTQKLQAHAAVSGD